MHATGIELHHAISVRQPAVTNTCIFRIQLDDIDTGNQGIEDVLAFGHALERRLDAGYVSTVLHRDAIARRYDHRPDPGPDLGGWRLCRGSNRRRGRDTCCGTGDYKITSADLLVHFSPGEWIGPVCGLLPRLCRTNEGAASGGEGNPPTRPGIAVEVGAD